MEIIGSVEVPTKQAVTFSLNSFQLKLSTEHQGFAFEKFPDVAATLLQHHSGGKVSTALTMATAVVESKK